MCLPFSAEGALRELAVAWKSVKESYQKHHEPIPKAPKADFYHRRQKDTFKILVDGQLYRVLTEDSMNRSRHLSLHTLVAQKFGQNRVFLIRTGLTQTCPVGAVMKKNHKHQFKKKQHPWSPGPVGAVS